MSKYIKQWLESEKEMTTELEQEFFKVFGIEPHWQYKVHQFCHFYYCNKKTIIKNAYLFQERKTCKVKEVKRVYPEITDRKLLEMICIYNSFQNDETSLFIPFDINNVKEVALQVITKSIEDKSLNKYYCNDVEKLKTNIQQLFKGEE